MPAPPLKKKKQKTKTKKPLRSILIVKLLWGWVGDKKICVTKNEEVAMCTATD